MATVPMMDIKKTRSILENVPDIIYRLDKDGKVIFINSSVKKYGYRPDALMGKPFINLVYPDDRDSVRQKINERRTGNRIKPFETRVLTLKTEQLPFELFSITAQGLYASSKPKKSSFQGTQGIAREVSLKKQMEKEKIQKEKQKSAVEMAGAVCHELNQPMQVILGYAEILLMQTPADSPLREKVLKIREQIARMGEITTQLMGITQYRTKDYLKTQIIDIEKSTQEGAQTDD